MSLYTASLEINFERGKKLSHLHWIEKSFFFYLCLSYTSTVELNGINLEKFKREKSIRIEFLVFIHTHTQHTTHPNQRQWRWESLIKCACCYWHWPSKQQKREKIDILFEMNERVDETSPFLYQFNVRREREVDCQLAKDSRWIFIAFLLPYLLSCIIKYLLSKKMVELIMREYRRRVILSKD